jgi:ABC-type transport system involved in multi-copper enzyme maturation permease subunit
MASVMAHERLVGGAVSHNAPGRANFFGAVRSELTKIRSVRSTWWTLLAMFVVCVGLGALFSWGQTQRLGAIANDHAFLVQREAEIRSAAVAVSLFGLLIGQLVMTVLGALTITSEYSTGMIRTSLATMPRRGTWFAAKGVVFGLVALVAGLITSFTAFFVGQAILSSWHANVTLSDHNVLRSVIGGGLFLAACGLLSFGIGAILRHSAGAISSAIGLLFVTLILSNFLPGPPSGWLGQIDIDKWIPFYAGAHLWQNQMIGLNPFSPWIGFGVFCAYAAAAIGGGLFLFLRRDA